MGITLTGGITVRAVQSMGGDHMVVAAAKVSTGGEDALSFAAPACAESNAGLISFLMKHRHGTPFEHSALTFFVHAPILVRREWHRHRVGFCLAGDTEIWNESIGLNHGRTLRKRRLKDLYDVWANGVKDSTGLCPPNLNERSIGGQTGESVGRQPRPRNYRKRLLTSPGWINAAASRGAMGR